MKKINKILLLSPIFLAMSSGLTSCGDSSSERVTLKIINSEDYIFIDEEDRSNDMTEQFKRYVKELAKENPEEYGRLANVEVVYDTSDTNETLYSELQTGKSDYDLINVSDYMAQKMVSEGLVVPLYRDEPGQRREDKVPNYINYASPTLRGRLDNITAPIYSEWVDDPDHPGEKVHKYAKLEDYAVGYMWGTLGILFNPEYGAYSNYDVSEVIEDMHYSFSALWNTKYNGSISIKNSMRDTFAAGLMKAYEEDFISLKENLDDGTYDVDTYMAEYAKVFNGEKENNFNVVVNNVQNSLNSLKNNIFGLEVDSGKQDIVTGKIGVNLAWSGDAVYSMDQAEDGNLVGENQSTLYYCVPELGSNLWFDTWVMPKNDNRSEERRELALMFLDFMSDPANASQNMDYTGYTSFIGGGDILELVRDWYDIRTDEIYEEVEVKQYNYEYYQVYAVHDDEVEENKDFFALDYPDFMKDTHNAANDEYLLYYFVPYSYVDESTGEEVAVDEPESIEDLLDEEHSYPVLVDDETQKKYGDLTIVDRELEPGEVLEYDIVDLSYFFNGTLDDGDPTTEDYEEDVDTIFYSAKYYARNEDGEPYTFIDEENEHLNNSVGRQFFTQYPDEATITRCAVMKDFGENNKLVMKMWEEFKSDPLPTSSLVIFIVIIASGIALGAFIITNKVLVNRIRKKRRGKEQK